MGRITFFLSFSLAATLSFAAQSESLNEKYYNLSEPIITEATEVHPLSAEEIELLQYDTSCSQQNLSPGTPSNVVPPVRPVQPGLPVVPPKSGPGIPALPKIGPANPADNIVNVGKMIWEIIKENKPTAQFKSNKAYAMPSGIRCWADLENWARPMSKNFDVSYRNGYGAEVVKFQVKLIYYYGGQLAEAGAYLANVALVPSQVHTSWGFNLDAQVKIDHPVNLGSKKSPIAGLGISVEWQVESLLSNKIQSLNLFVDGQGNVELL